MAAAFGESHPAERRQSPGACCCWLAGIHDNRPLVARQIGRPDIIFRGTGKRISQVEKAAWHPGVDVDSQGCAWADSDYCNPWVDKTFKAAVTGGFGVKPPEQSIVFADNLHGQTTEEFEKYLMEGCNTLLGLLPPGCTDEVQSVDAGYGRLVKLVGKGLEAWHEEGDNVEGGTPSSSLPPTAGSC